MGSLSGSVQWIESELGGNSGACTTRGTTAAGDVWLDGNQISKIQPRMLQNLATKMKVPFQQINPLNS